MDSQQMEQLNRLRGEMKKSEVVKCQFKKFLDSMQEIRKDVSESVSDFRQSISNIIVENLPEPLHMALSKPISLVLNEADQEDKYPSNYRQEISDENRQMMLQKRKEPIISKILVIVGIVFGGYLLTQPGFFADVFEKILGILDRFKDLLKSVWIFLRDLTKSIVSVLKDWIKNMWNYISGTATS